MNINKSIGPSTQRYAVLGEHLDHTWSPYIHNTLFEATGNDAVYLPIIIDSAHFSSVIDVLRYGFKGFNVTIPYKEKILPYLDELDDRARALKAVNTVEVVDGRLIGHNTDGMGMIRAIEAERVPVTGVHALILGGGGAARVAGYEILERGGTVDFALRNPQKASGLIASFEDAFGDAASRIHAIDFDAVQDSYDILINCTPVGMFPNQDACPVEERVLESIGAVFDAVYNPRETRLLNLARARGIPAVEGLGMLFYEAVEAQRFWRLLKLPPEQVQKEVYRALCASF